MSGKVVSRLQLLLVLISFSFFLPTMAKAADSKTRPNVLWLIAEDMGPVLGCYGTKEVSTPNLDELAKKGIRYTRAYTTAPVCSPSRSGFMTGMYATTIGAQHHRTAESNKPTLPEGVQTLPDWLREAGYYTANVVQFPKSFGFKGTGKTDWNFKRMKDGPPFDGNTWADLSAHQPFYAQVNFQETHRTYHAPAHADPAKVQIPSYYPDHPVTRKDWAEYLDAATEVDRKIGLILADLKKSGLDQNTIILFFGDNGASHVRGKQFCYEEGFLVPLIVYWPAGLTPPKQFAAGKVEDQFIEAIDFAATTLAIAGVKKPAKMQGHVFLGPDADPVREYAFGARDRCDETAMRIRSVRDARYRYIRNFTPEVPFLAANAYKEKQYPVWNLLKELHAQGKLTPAQEFLCQPRQPEEELYDLQADPEEIHNLAADPAHAQALVRLRGVLGKWIVDTDDKGRIPEFAGTTTGNNAAKKKAGQKQ